MKKWSSNMIRFYCLLGTLFLSWSVLAEPSRAACGEVAETVLSAGQNMPAGLVLIENDDNFLYVTYLCDEDWMITETHLAVATSPEDLPQTGKGNPIPGQFTYKTEHPSGVTEVTHTVAIDNFVPGTPLYIAAHSVVNSSSGSETAWGEGADFPGDNWGMYFSYDIEPCDVPPANPGYINFAEPDVTVLELETSVIVFLVRSEGSDGEVQVTLAYNDITATRDADYQAPVTTVTFEDGQTSKHVEFFILPDDAVEGDESFTIEIVDVVNAEIGSQSDMTCTIIDDDGVIDDDATGDRPVDDGPVDDGGPVNY